MKITKNYLKQVIMEEYQKVQEAEYGEPEVGFEGALRVSIEELEDELEALMLDYPDIADNKHYSNVVHSLGVMQDALKQGKRNLYSKTYIDALKKIKEKYPKMKR